MRIRVARTYGQLTPFGLFTNLFNRADRRHIGGWYCNLHLGPIWIESYSTR